jgi:YD repeat-containing protein
MHDAAANVISRTSPNGDTRTATFDALRRLVQTSAPAPLGYVRTFSYDGEGNLLSRTVNTSAGALVTSYTYGAHDELLTVTEPVDAAGTTTRTTSFEYDDNFNRIRTVRPLGNKQKFEYDERDLLLKHVLGEGDPAAATTTFFHDSNGNRTDVTDPLSNTTTTQFDLFDRPTRVTNALGHYTETTYDKAGRVTKVERKDSSNNLLQRRSFFYDERGRLWKTSDLRKDPGSSYADSVTTIHRDKMGRITKVTDALGNDTNHE